MKYILSVRKHQSLFNHTLFVEVFIKTVKCLLNVRKRLIIYSLLKSSSDQIADFIYVKEFNKSSSQLTKFCSFLSQCCSQLHNFVVICFKIQVTISVRIFLTVFIILFIIFFKISVTISVRIFLIIFIILIIIFFKISVIIFVRILLVFLLEYFSLFFITFFSLYQL